MKKYSYSIIAALVMLLSVNTFAQKSVVFVNMATAGKAIDEKTMSVTFQLNNVPNETVKQKFESSFKSANQGISDVKGTLQSGGTASYTVVLPKQRHMAAMQKMFITSGIETVNVDGTDVEVNNLLTYIESKKKK